MLRGVVEFDVAGPGDLKPAEFMQRQSFGPEAVGGSFWGERYGDVHGVCFVVADFVVFSASCAVFWW
jgi:hypothetical protein